MRSDLENRVALLGWGLRFGALAEVALLAWGAIAVPEPGWFAGAAVAALALVLLVVAGRRRPAPGARSGSGVLALGGVLVGAAPFVAAVVGNAT